MEYSNTEIGKRIRKNREKLGLTQSQLGESLSKNIKDQRSEHAISEYESGLTPVPINVLYNLCNVFNCELGYLLGEDSYSEGTALKTKIRELTGLSNRTIDILSKDYFKKADWIPNIDCEIEIDKPINIINKLFKSTDFGNFIFCLCEYDACVNKFNKIMDEYNEIDKNSKEEDETWTTVEDFIKSDAGKLDALSQKMSSIEKEALFAKYVLSDSFNAMINSIFEMHKYWNIKSIDIPKEIE